MTLTLILCAALWGVGWAMGAPVRQRLVLVGGLWLASLIGFLVLPVGSAFGGDARLWAMFSLLGAAIFGYFALIKWLRVRVKAPENAVKPGAFQAAELERYARHILLREIGGPGQKALKSAKVLVIGAGGLGSPALLYLAAAGVGVIGIIDDDVVEASNLQRQIIHKDQGIGMPKVQSALEAVTALNPYVEVRPYRRRFGPEVVDLIGEYDLILDGSDNFDTRYLVNAVAVRAGKPLISAAITQWEGQISVYDPKHGSPCYACIFPTRPLPGMVPTCAEAGVAAPLPGVVGSMMALEAVKHITGAGEGLKGRLMIYDALYAEVRVIGIERRADCAVCGALRAVG